jgi:hypothetical protein
MLAYCTAMQLLAMGCTAVEWLQSRQKHGQHSTVSS